jgi:hypothetical protein
LPERRRRVTGGHSLSFRGANEIRKPGIQSSRIPGPATTDLRFAHHDAFPECRKDPATIRPKRY